VDEKIIREVIRPMVNISTKNHKSEYHEIVCIGDMFMEEDFAELMKKSI
jgi:hypothetical protein